MTRRTDYETAKSLFFGHQQHCGICNQVEVKEEKLSTLNQLCLKGAQLLKDAIIKKRNYITRNP